PPGYGVSDLLDMAYRTYWLRCIELLRYGVLGSLGTAYWDTPVRCFVHLGTLSRYKAHLVTNGSSHQLGVDFDETFSPVIKPATGSQVAYLLIYVDDINLTTSSPVLLQQIINSLHNEFDMTDLGALNYFIGISATCTPTVDKESKLDLKGVSVQDPTLYRSLAWGYNILHLHGTVDFGLQLYISATTSLVGYKDADWAGYPFTRSTVYMSANPVQYQRTKHIEIDIHFVRDMVTAGQVRVLHVPSCFQYADIFTKGLPSALFEDFRSSLSVRPPPAPTARAY
ncbi:ribonuclease H-like domain-containing protein, partial [Tanacetum coccineum]